MSAQPSLTKPEDLVERYRAAFESLDMRNIMQCFTDDVVVQYNDLLEIHGKPAQEHFP
jgi:ketosteroid isomerase-like protein